MPTYAAPRKRMETTNGKHTKGKPTSENKQGHFSQKSKNQRKGKDGLPKHPILQGLLLLVHLFDFFDHSRCLYNDRMKEDSGGVPTYGRWRRCDFWHEKTGSFPR